MQPGSWEVEVRPAMAAQQLALHQEALAFLSQGKSSEAVARWRTLSKMAPEDPAWLRVWIKARAGKELYQARGVEDGTRFFAEAEERCALAGAEVCRQVLLQHALTIRADFVTSGNYAQLAVQQAREEMSPLALASTLGFVGLQSANHGDIPRARETLEEALKIQQELAPQSIEMARSLQSLSLAAINDYDLARAEQLAAKSLAILERAAPEGTDILASLSFLAMVSSGRGDLTRKEGYLRREVAIAKKASNDPIMLAASLRHLGDTLMRMGDLKEAEKCTREALAVLEGGETKQNALVLSQILGLLGELAAERGDWPQAEAYLLRGLAVIEQSGPEGFFLVDHLNLLADMYSEKHDLPQAMRYCRRSHDLAERLDPGGAYVTSADSVCAHTAWKFGSLSEAEGYFAEAAALLARWSPGSIDEADATAGLARVRSRQGRFVESRELFERAMRSMDAAYARLGGGAETRAGYRAELMEYYSDYIDLLMRYGDRERAFEILELSRARGLLEMLNFAHVDLAKGSDPSLLEDLRRLQRQISAKSEERAALLTSKGSEMQVKALEKEISALTAQAGEMEGRIRSALPAYSAVANPQPLSVHQAQELLDPDTLLLEYALGAERSYLFAVSASSLQTFSLPGRAEIEKAARRVYSLLTAPNQIISGEPEIQRQRRLRSAQVHLDAALATLSGMVLAPFADQLSDKRLIVAADGTLNYIPFAMLPEISPNPEAGRQTTPLIVRHEIVNLPSASVLAVLRRQEAHRPRAGKAVAVFADPVFEKTDSRIKQAAASGKQRPSKNSEYSLSANLLTRSAGDLGLSRNGQLSLPRLLFAREEAEAIRAVTPHDKIKVALDFQASRSSVTSTELRDYRIVHFATHGLINSEHPELSGLVLSLVDEQGKPQDGFLQLQDIYNLNLSSDLVVLSACETGLGKEISGEGLMGLTRGFMHAGASRVVASLWKVSDAATAKLMSEFYRAMEAEHMSPAAALRAAQIQMWKQKRWSSPYYWAAFQIQGEWK